MANVPLLPSCSQRSAAPKRGFTLIELLVVVSITGILVAMAVPMFNDYVARQAMDAQISALASSIRVARSEALKRSMPVTLCPSSNPDAAQPTCDLTADATRGWATGWLLFTDWGTRGVFEANSDTIISRQSALTNSGGITPSVSGYTLTFLPNGLAPNDQGRFVFKTVTEPNDTKRQRTVCVSSTGSTRLVKGGNC